MLVVEDREQAEVADQLRRQVLADEALVLEVAHRVVAALAASGVPARSGNQSRSSSVGSSQMRLMSVYIAKPSAYGLMPL